MTDNECPKCRHDNPDGFLLTQVDETWDGRAIYALECEYCGWFVALENGNSADGYNAVSDKRGER